MQPACVQQTLGPDYVEFTANCTGCGHCVDLSARSDKPEVQFIVFTLSVY